MNRLKGKRVLITGATAGIGRELAILLAEDGCNLILNGRREQRLHDLAHELSTRYPSQDVEQFLGDVGDKRVVQTFFEGRDASKPIDILVNNAGFALGVDPVYKGDLEDWDAMIQTNVHGVLYLSRFVSEQMVQRKAGHILNVCSIAGHEAYPGGVVYTATKHAVKAITQATKKDVHGTNIRVSMVSPGLVETEFSDVRYKGDKAKASSVYKNIEALTANDIAEIIQFILHRPDHVNILDTVVLPTAQSSAQMVHRDGPPSP
jgi:NADP-dependent 3-hydroxy acid dehydrogenase YdfG